jgi:hypothetical protein
MEAETPTPTEAPSKPSSYQGLASDVLERHIRASHDRPLTEDDVLFWLDPVEKGFWLAVTCPDLTVSLSVGVRLAEFAGLSSKKRLVLEKKETPEQHEREVLASELLDERYMTCLASTVRTLLHRLAVERKKNHALKKRAP